MCDCTSWKSANPQSNSKNTSDASIDESDNHDNSISNTSADTDNSSLQEACKSCGHPLTSHIVHLKHLDDKELNKLLSMTVDMDSIWALVSNQHIDNDTKQVNSYINRIKCLLVS